MSATTVHSIPLNYGKHCNKNVQTVLILTVPTLKDIDVEKWFLKKCTNAAILYRVAESIEALLENIVYEFLLEHVEIACYIKNILEKSISFLVFLVFSFYSYFLPGLKHQRNNFWLTKRILWYLVSFYEEFRLYVHFGYGLIFHPSFYIL